MEKLQMMKLGEKVKFDIWDIWRVPGGWIFACDGGGKGLMSLFVEDNEKAHSELVDFMERREKDIHTDSSPNGDSLLV